MQLLLLWSIHVYLFLCICLFDLHLCIANGWGWREKKEEKNRKEQNENGKQQLYVLLDFNDHVHKLIHKTHIFFAKAFISFAMANKMA